MANIIKTLTNRLIEARGTNKAFPCKTYATEAAAEKAVEKSALLVAQHFDRNQREDVVPANWVVFFMPEWNRWVAAIDMTEVMHRPTSSGGYLGVEAGFFKW